MITAEQRFINEEKFRATCEHYEIDGIFVQHLRTLINYKLVIIADDSGSMNTLTNYGEARWSELCRFVQTVFSVTEAIENSPLDVYFLNRPSILNVQQLAQISDAFIPKPKGPTPIVPILQEILRQPYNSTYSGRIIIICTDGEPTDVYNKVNVNQLYNVLLTQRSRNDYVSFLACTDDDSTIAYLNDWDVKIPRVDVIDDYPNEKKEVIRAQGRHFSFSFGDYVVKTLLGAVIPSLDALDERRGVDMDCVLCSIS